MARYLVRRLLYMVPTLWAVSVVSFFIIQLPPGNFVVEQVSRLQAEGATTHAAEIAQLKAQYGLDQPFWIQYWRWITGIVLRGDFGQSFEWSRPVATMIHDRLAVTVAIALGALLVSWLIAFPIGIYSAARQYSVGDYVFTTIGFLGLAIPHFLLALVFMYIAFRYFGQSPGGIFSPAYEDADWNLGKVLDLVQHLWVPIIIIGTGGTAGLIRVLRANLLDELHKPYVVTARAKGLSETRLLLKYPVRTALSPFISTVGWVLPALVSGGVIVEVVLNLPTTGPLLLRALMAQDMYLAGAFILLLSMLTVVGTLVSDLLLAWLDPRIRYRYR